MLVVAGRLQSVTRDTVRQLPVLWLMLLLFKLVLFFVVIVPVVGGGGDVVLFVMTSVVF